MKIVVAAKIVPDDSDIIVASDGSLDYSKAHQTVSAYDQNALEIAARLKEAAEGATVHAVCVGPAAIDDSKLKKGILAKGIDELFLVADDACDGLDAYQTAAALVPLIERAGGADLVVCGDGSADNYAQQVDVQLAAALGIPVITSATAIELGDGKVTATRMLENEMQTVSVALPAVVSVVPDIAMPRIASMKDILAAGKKPQEVVDAAAVGGVAEGCVKTVSVKAPEPAPRRGEMFDASKDGGLDGFVAAALAALR